MTKKKKELKNSWRNKILNKEEHKFWNKVDADAKTYAQNTTDYSIVRRRYFYEHIRLRDFDRWLNTHGVYKYIINRLKNVKQ